MQFNPIRSLCEYWRADSWRERVIPMGQLFTQGMFVMSIVFAGIGLLG